MRIATVVVLSGALACSEGSDGPAVPGAEADGRLPGTEWELNAFGPEGVGDPAVPPAITVTFGADSTFAGSAGCNRYFGRFRTPGGDSLTLGEAGSTMMACPEPAMAQEHRYLQALVEVTQYRSTPEELVLLDDSGVLLRFVRLSGD